MFHEKDFEDILCKYPELIEEGLLLKGRQLVLYGRRMDLLFEDKFKRKLIIELKKGPIKDDHIGQVMSYEGMLLSADDPTIRIMLVGSRVPPNIQRSLDHHGIAWREITFSSLRQFISEKNDASFLKLLDEEELPNTRTIKLIQTIPVYKTTDELIFALKSSENYKSFKSVLNQKINNEDNARGILIENLGNLNHDHIEKIIALIDNPYLFSPNDKIHNGPWFGRLLHANTGNLLTIDLAKLNNWFNILSNTYLPIEKKIDLLISEPSIIPGLNVGFITLMLYLLEKNTYSIWFKGLHVGLKLIYSEIGDYTGKSNQYAEFNNTAIGFIKKYNFEPVELDWILSTGIPGMLEESGKVDSRNNSFYKKTDSKILQLEYWTGLKSFMENRGSFIKIRRPQQKEWSDISLGRSDIYLTAGINAKTNLLIIWLVIRGEKRIYWFDKLYNLEYQNSLSAISDKIKWDRMPNRQRCGVTLRQSGDYSKKNDWENQFEWFKENLEKFVRFFKPRIINI